MAGLGCSVSFRQLRTCRCSRCDRRTAGDAETRDAVVRSEHLGLIDQTLQRDVPAAGTRACRPRYDGKPFVERSVHHEIVPAEWSRNCSDQQVKLRARNPSNCMRDVLAGAGVLSRKGAANGGDLTGISDPSRLQPTQHHATADHPVSIRRHRLLTAGADLERLKSASVWRRCNTQLRRP
jgi:hypothetical protein